MLSDERIERYARHILLREVGGKGQERILDARARIEGLGPPGLWAAHFLALAGVGTLELVDARGVPPEGLPPLLPAGAVGSRARAAAAAIATFNPDVRCSLPGGEAPGGDEAWMRLEGAGSLWVHAAGGVAMVGWSEAPPCGRCVERGGPPAGPEASALAGSLAASLLLRGVLFGEPIGGITRYEDGGAEPLHRCLHR